MFLPLWAMKEMANYLPRKNQSKGQNNLPRREGGGAPCTCLVIQCYLNGGNSQNERNITCIQIITYEEALLTCISYQASEYF